MKALSCAGCRTLSGGKALIAKSKSLARWYVKKLARALVVNTAHPRARFRREVPHAGCVRVLTYHRFADERRDPFCVSRHDFDTQMALLASEGRAVSLAQVVSFLKGDTNLPKDACLVTIDDGMRSTLTEAVPVLEKYGVPAVAFVSSKLVGLRMSDLPEPYLTCEELKVLHSSDLMTVGSHAHTHRSMGELAIEEMRDEAITSRKLLSDYIGCDVNSFAYPFGMQKDFNDETDHMLRIAGYEIAFNSMHGAITRNMQPVSLPRVKIEGGESLGMFSGISRGGMDDWRLIDDKLWRTQRVRREIS